MKVMLKHNYLFLAGVAACLLGVTSCIDDKYDLSDIDTTVEVKVNNLTIPVNLEEVKLSSIFSLDENSCIKKINGQYALVETGNFSSDEILVDKQHVTAPEIYPSKRYLDQLQTLPSGMNPMEVVVQYDMVEIMGEFIYDKTDMPSEIRGLTHLDVDWTLDVRVDIDDPDNVFRAITMKDVVINFPKGFEAKDSRYDPLTGDFTLGDVTLEQGEWHYDFVLEVSGVDLSVWTEKEYQFTPATGVDNGHIRIDEHIGVKSGIAEVTVLADHKPHTVLLTMTPVLSEFLIESFSGSVQYEFDNFNIPDIKIDDLPDLLTDENTNIVLENPQLYISLNNPVADYQLLAETSLEMTPVRNGVTSEPVSLDKGEMISIGYDKGVTGPYNFCVSPKCPDSFYQGFENADHVGCTAFSDLLSGKGVPDAIRVNLPGARVPADEVRDFKLGVSLGKVKGDYTVYCPLQFGVGSEIRYSDTIDGWNDESLDRIKVSELALNADITNELPFDVILTGYPLSIDSAGKSVRSVDPDTGEEVSISEVRVPAGMTAPLSVTTDGVVTHLDGIYFEARALVDSEGDVLSPDTTVKLSNIKVVVSGSYTDTL